MVYGGTPPLKMNGIFVVQSPIVSAAGATDSGGTLGAAGVVGVVDVVGVEGVVGGGVVGTGVPAAVAPSEAHKPGIPLTQLFVFSLPPPPQEPSSRLPQTTQKAPDVIRMIILDDV